MEGKKAVILLNLGGPESLGDVRPFLYKLFSDREILPLGPAFLQRPLALALSTMRSWRTRKGYERIGGGSPLRRITEKQARALESELKGEYKVFVGMRYWHPTIGEAVRRIVAQGMEELVALPLFPHYSRATTGTCLRELWRSLEDMGAELETRFIESWHDNPLYIRALAGTVESGLKGFARSGRGEVHILYSAHALPKSFVDEGDPYVDQVRETVRLVSELFEHLPHSLSFQSRSGPVEWIEPETSSRLRELAEEGVGSVLMVPVSFVSDHFETLYEMDVLYSSLAAELGMSFHRAPALNAAPELIRALASLLTEGKINSALDGVWLR